MKSVAKCCKLLSIFTCFTFIPFCTKTPFFFFLLVVCRFFFYFTVDCFLLPCNFLYTFLSLLPSGLLSLNSSRTNTHYREIRDLLMVTEGTTPLLFQVVLSLAHTCTTQSQKMRRAVFSPSLQLPCCLLPSSLKLTAALFAKLTHFEMLKRVSLFLSQKSTFHLPIYLAIMLELSTV